MSLPFKKYLLVKQNVLRVKCKGKDIPKQKTTSCRCSSHTPSFLHPSDFQLVRFPQLHHGQLCFYQVQRRGSPAEEPVQPTDLQRRGFSLVCQLCHRAGAVHPRGGLFLLLLGLHQTRRYPHVPRDCWLHTLTQVG